MRLIRTSSVVNRSALGVAFFAWVLIAAFTMGGQARQQRTVASGVYLR